jgi:histidyl-tRNA synthetase
VKWVKIGKVYQRDQPATDCGWMRGFCQCDLDYSGALDLMVPDLEIICFTAEVFETLELDFTITINHHLILDSIFTAVSVAGQLTLLISSLLTS